MLIDRDRTSPVEVLVTVPFLETEIQALRELSPRLRVTALSAAEAREIPNEVWNRSEVVYTDRVFPAPEQAPSLRWIQCHWAGIEALLDEPILQKSDILVTTLSGAAAPQMAEYALGAILELGHRLLEIGAQQTRMDWPRERWERYRPQELRGSTVGIVGYGSVGREIARLLNAFGAKVLATKRDVMHPQDPGYSIPGLGDPGGEAFHRLYPYQALKSMLKECDFVVVTLPLTAETRGLVGAAELAAMKPSAYLIHLARGGTVDQAALLAALQEKRIAGAVLDVFAEEPLPASSPLWKLSNVILTPHIAGLSDYYNERAMELFIENCKRYLAGSPLLNRFDPQKGY